MSRLISRNNYRLSISIFIFLSGFVLASCHKEVTSTDQTGSARTISYTQIFEDFWSNMNKNYVFWEQDTTNWNRVHDMYAPMFAELDKDSTISYDSVNTLSNSYFQNMVSGLTDSHYFLAIYYTLYGVNPAQVRKLNNPLFIENLFETAPYSPSVDGKFHYTNYVDSLYLDDNKMIGIDTSITVTDNFYTVAGYIQNTRILYFAFNKCQLITQYEQGDPTVKATLGYFFKQLSNPALTGLIIDVRGNSGGSVNDLNFLVGSLISSPLHFGYSRSKNGAGRLDYTPWANAIINPRPGFSDFTKPIVVLADGETSSEAELTTMALKSLPKTTFVGDTTWGANGQLIQNVDYNAGSFNFGNIVTGVSQSSSTTFYFGYASASSVAFKYLDGNVYEGKGFPPDYDIKVKLNQVFLPGNTIDDPQLDKAISLLPK